jgi:hypothetical protein
MSSLFATIFVNALLISPFFLTGENVQSITAQTAENDSLITYNTTDDSELLKESFFAISLGSNCMPSIHLRNSPLHKRSFPFDVCATPFKALYEIIENDFVDFLNLEYLFAPDAENDLTVTNLKYNFQIAHTFTPTNWINSEHGFHPANTDGESECTHVLNTYERRIKRFIDVMNSGIPVYLFRLDRENEIQLSDTGENNDAIENSKNQAEMLDALLKKKFPNANFQLIYFYELTNKSSQYWDLINNIIYFYPQEKTINTTNENDVPSFSNLFTNLVSYLQEKDDELSESEKEFIINCIEIGQNKSIEFFYEDLDFTHKMQAQLAKIPQIKLLKFAFSNPGLRESMQSIFSQELKNNLMLMLFDIEVDKIKNKKLLSHYISTISHEFKLEKEKISYFINQKDYNGLFLYINSSFN